MLSRIFMALFFMLVFISPVNVYPALFNSLKDDIQRELDANPFLQNEGIELNVKNEENGYVTLEMLKGNKIVREKIFDGKDIDSPLWTGSGKEERNTINALRKTIEVIKKIDGVKAVSLESAKPTDLKENLEIIKNIVINYEKDKKSFPQTIVELDKYKAITNLPSDIEIYYMVGEGNSWYTLVAISENDNIGYITSQGVDIFIWKEEQVIKFKNEISERVHIKVVENHKGIKRLIENK